MLGRSLASAELHESIGEFPTKGVILHHHLAKLHLHSHVFRGLKGAPVPSYFQDSAVAAVAAATAIIETVLTDNDIRDGLVGIPHYIHSMIAFACVFVRTPVTTLAIFGLAPLAYLHKSSTFHKHTQYLVK